jgi:hypothetical protein
MDRFMNMRRAIALLAMAAAPAHAQQPNLKPYKPLSVQTAPGGDAALAALIATLAKAAEGKRFAPFAEALSPHYAAYNCPGDPLAACGPGKSRSAPGAMSPAARLRLAFCCQGKPQKDISQKDAEETLFATAAAAFAAGAFSAADKPGHYCAPALPRFDRAAAAKAARDNGVDAANIQATSAEIAMRARPEDSAPTVLTLPKDSLAFAANNLTAEIPAGWTAYVLPNGTIGYARGGAMSELVAPSFCFAREKGAWKLAYTLQQGQ